ncbi:hypothetical protein SDC9_123280 [bioreactor metagenome]|uniref:Uncharacterized protein n=1 Tax=bioreactor metagenome TaxID=1076179 RepID=A0A645CHC3_9ZZZZ
MTGCDPGSINFCNNTYSTGDLDGFSLSTTHSSQTGGDEQLASKVAFIGNAKHQTSGVKQRVVGSMDYSLRSDIHPASGSHLSIVRYAKRLCPVVVFQIIVHSDHETVGNNDSGCFRAAMEQSDRVSRVENQGFIFIELFQIFLDQLILHPVLANRTCFSVGYQFIRVECHFKVKVIVNHDLEGFSFNTVGFVLIDGLSVQSLLWHVAIAVDFPLFFQFLIKFLGHCLMMLFRNVAQRILHRQQLVRF